MSWKTILAIDLAVIVVYSVIAAALLRAIPDGAPEHLGWGVAVGLVIGGIRAMALWSLGDQVSFGDFRKSLRRSFWGRAADAVSIATLPLMVVLTLLRPMQEHGFRILLGALVAQVVREVVVLYPTYRLAYSKEAQARAGRSGDSGVPSSKHDHQRSE